MAWERIWKLAVIIAWDATMAAKIEEMSPGQKHPGGSARIEKFGSA